MAQQHHHEVAEPTEVRGDIGLFDRFAGGAAAVASRAPFFAGCVVLVAAWLTQGLMTMLVTGNPGAFLNDRYQLEINTTTTIVTFLMVALLQNAQTRSDQAIQTKLNVVADSLADLMDYIAAADRCGDVQRDLRVDMEELRAAVGLELRETSSGR